MFSNNLNKLAHPSNFFLEKGLQLSPSVPYSYKSINFLYSFLRMGFNFSAETPDLLVEKIYSMDNEGHPYYECYGNDSTEHQASSATSVPCLEGEVIIIRHEQSMIYSYYVCVVDFANSHLFRIVKDFTSIGDAFRYLASTKLVSLTDTLREEETSHKVSPFNTRIIEEILCDSLSLKVPVSYEQLISLFLENAESSTFFYESLERDKSLYKLEKVPKEEFVRIERAMKNSNRSLAKRFLPVEPFSEGDANNSKMSVIEYVRKIQNYRENHIWNK